MFEPGDVVLTKIQFVDTLEVKKRPALVLFEEYNNVVIAGMTSNLNMQGIKINKRKNLPKDSIIKLNYIFTVSKEMIYKKLISLRDEEKKEIYEQFKKRLSKLKS